MGTALSKAAYNKAYREANKEKLAAYKRQWNIERADKMRAYFAAYREANKEKLAEYKRQWNIERADKMRAYFAAHYQANKTRISARQKDYLRTRASVQVKANLKKSRLNWVRADKKANPEKYILRDREWDVIRRTKFRDRLKKQKACSYEKHKEKILAKHSAYKKANRPKYNALGARRRARQMSQVCLCCTPAQIRAVFEKCPPGSEVDHRVPLALGGLHCVNNLQILSFTEHKIKTFQDDVPNIVAYKRTLKALQKAA